MPRSNREQSRTKSAVTRVATTEATDQAEVECCIDNVDMDEFQEIKASDKSVDMQYCLQRCGICYKRPFFVVDGDVVSGTSHLDLLNCLDLEDSCHE